MYESEDGTVVGSIDRSKLGDLNPKSDEAKAQVEQLRREAEEADKQSAADAERVAELHRNQNQGLHQASRAGRTGPSGDAERSQAERSQRDQQRDAQRQQAEADKNQPAQSEDVTQLQAEAEQAGVTVDKRWGADRLRQEIDTAKAASARKQR